MPIPIQLGAITDRMRKFFRIRGPVKLQLDEMVAPVVIVQDLTVGPYQAGVTPCAGTIGWILPALAPNQGLAILLNDKAGSLTPVLDKQFDGRSFSVTWMEMQNATLLVPDPLNWQVNLTTRAAIVAAGVPDATARLLSIQDNDGSLSVPIDFFAYDLAPPQDGLIWRGITGDNTNTLGSRRTVEPEPNITIGPDDAILIRQTAGTLSEQTIDVSVRGFYQEQPS